MQRRHEEEQQLLAQLEKAAKLHRAEHMAQKARRKRRPEPRKRPRDRGLQRRRRGRRGRWNTSSDSGTKC